MSMKKAVLKSFDSGSYLATIEIAGSHKTYLEDVSVARNLPAVEMSTGRKVAVIFFDRNNPADSMVMAVY